MEKFDENDSFWSLDSMLPPKKKSSYTQTQNKTLTDVSLSEIEISGDPMPKGEPIPAPLPMGEAIPKPKYPPITSENKRALSFDAWLSQRREYEKIRYTSGKELLASYKPENPLIKEVRISAEKNRRPVNERFLTEGMMHVRQSAEFKGNVPFDSIYPQYAVLNAEQLNCFLGFRNEVFCGRFPQIDRAYIYLLLYELINLTEIYSPSNQAETIASLIVGYSACDDRLFADMCNWLCDICLIYRLQPPKAVFGDCYSRVLKLASVKEFYMHDSSPEREDIMLSVLYTAGRYNYKTSNFYKAFPEMYDNHIKTSCCQALNEISKNNSILSSYEKDICTLTHESYFGALCTNAVRRTVEIECYCITREEKIKKLVTDLVKYSENCLRARLGISQRLTVNSLSLDIKQFFKNYYAQNVPMHDRISKKSSKKVLRDINERPEYEKLYEPAKTELNLRTASEIEQASWGITERLITAFESEEDEAFSSPKAEGFTDSIAPATQEIQNSNIKSATADSSEETTVPKKHRLALQALLDGNTDDFNRIAKSENMLPSAYADKINEELFEFIGDSAIENDGININISEFYIDDIRSLLVNE